MTSNILLAIKIRGLAGAFLVAASCLAAADTALDCGTPSEIPGGYGPFDYRTATQEQKHLVEIAGGHFTTSVETLQSGTTGSIGAELGYTLGSFPNHPRALMAMIRLGQRDKTAKPHGGRYTVQCYVERAILYRPDDMTVRQIHAVYYAMQKKFDIAIADLKMVIEQEPQNANAHYNLGLAYFETGDYDTALAKARQARALGLPHPGLADKLKAKGKWKD